jgi:hypothetical protein
MLRGDYKTAHKKLLAAQAKDPGSKFIQNNLDLAGGSRGRQKGREVALNNRLMVRDALSPHPESQAKRGVSDEGRSLAMRRDSRLPKNHRKIIRRHRHGFDEAKPVLRRLVGHRFHVAHAPFRIA